MSVNLDKKIFKLIQEIKKIKNPEFCEELLHLLEDYVDKHHAHASDGLDQKIKSLLLKNNPHFNPEQLPFLQLFNSSEHVAILNQASEFQSINPAYAKVVGYQMSEQLLGLSYENFKGDAVSQCDFFKAQDKQVMESQKNLEFLSYHCYGDGNWHLLWGEKSSILDENNQSVGIYSRAKDITNHPLIDMSRFLMREAQNQFGRFRQQYFIYYVDKEYE
jgi:PAS domain S-box-containing protein